jgi:hypothetical protein
MMGITFPHFGDNFFGAFPSFPQVLEDCGKLFHKNCGKLAGVLSALCPVENVENFSTKIVEK